MDDEYEIVEEASVPARLDRNYWYMVNGGRVLAQSPFAFKADSFQLDFRYIRDRQGRIKPASGCINCDGERVAHDFRAVAPDITGYGFELSFRTGYCKDCAVKCLEKAVAIYNRQKAKLPELVDYHECRWRNSNEVYEVIETYRQNGKCETRFCYPSTIRPKENERG